METTDKEARFDLYCQSCKHAETKETEWPCNDCLSIPMVTHSRKPVYYREDSKMKKKGGC